MKYFEVLFRSLLLLPVCCLGFTATTEVPRVSPSRFVEIYQQANNPADETPILIENALTEQACEDICDKIASAGESLQVDLQRRRPYQPVAFYPMMGIRPTIDQIMFHSRHDDALWCFEEGLLDAAFPDIATQLKTIREFVFPNQDWFPYFPAWAQPTDCLILSGEGATSSLHRDPYEWTGTSICLEGSKVWRFIEPPKEGPRIIDEQLDSYRLPSTARDDETVLSAGWQSDLSLYKERSDDIPSAKELQNLNEKMELMRNIALDTNKLVPSKQVLSLLEGFRKNTLWSTVQTAGDLLVVPAHWWHQTYALEPSLAVASQRCSEREIRRVLQHMLDTTGLVDADEGLSLVDLDELIDYSNPELTVQRFFTCFSKASGTS